MALAIASVEATFSFLAPSKSLSTLSGNLCAAEWIRNDGFVSRTNASTAETSVRSTFTKFAPDLNK
jgi:hypothetical protein